MRAARLSIALFAALLVAVQAFRVATVAARPAQRPIAAERVWGSNPAIAIDRAMAMIGSAARTGEGIPEGAIALLHDAARRDLTAPEPFLADGARAETLGRGTEAERLFEAARARDPRNGAARYFLAGRYLASGRSDAGLAEISALARLVPGAGSELVPSLVAFARQPGSVPSLRRFFRISPGYEPLVLTALAQDGANAQRILRLASRRPGQPPQGWESLLVDRLVASGEPAKAQAVWARLAGVAPYRGVFNPDFHASDAPGPFGWTYDASGAGLATPQRGGGLELVYYGRNDADLAQQLLALAPGRYQLASRLQGGGSSDALSWVVECVPGGAKLASTPLAAPAILTVPASGCALQRLRLHGAAGDVERSTSLTILNVTIESLREG